MSNQDDRLLEFARAVSDSEHVDWSEAMADANGPGERELIGLIRDIGHLTELQRTRTKHPDRVSTTPHAHEAAPLANGAWAQLQVRGMLGKGASAEVFRARDRKLDRDVALKLFRHDYPVGPAQRHALLLEGRNLARLRHPNVVTIHGADEDQGRVGIWMELVEGRALSEIVKLQGPFSASEATQIGIELCGALAAVHHEKLVHADIKAQNIKREDGGRIVLMDFSSSRVADESPGNPESDPTGTPLYMSPELWEGATPSSESDIYALGVLLYYLVTGAFPVRARSIVSLRRAHAAGERHLLRDERPGLPDTFIRIVERALSPGAAERFPSAGAMEKALGDQAVGATSHTAPSHDLPPEVKVVARVARVGLWATGLASTLTLLGFITSNAFNVTIGRPDDFVSESTWEFFVWGFRALAPPIIYMVMFAAPFVIVIIFWQLLKLVPPIASAASRLRLAWASKLMTWSHPVFLATLIFACGLFALIGVCVGYADIILAAATPIAEVSREQLMALSPDNIDAHIAYGRLLDAIMLFVGYGSYRVYRLSKKR